MLEGGRGRAGRGAYQLLLNIKSPTVGGLAVKSSHFLHSNTIAMSGHSSQSQPVAD